MKRILQVFILTLLPELIFAQAGSMQQMSCRPFAIGVVEEIRSNVLGEKRILNIYLPEGYKAEDTIRYPVIYLLDGSANEDFIHIAGLVQFSSFEWVNQVPKSIVVGIANIDRRRDFTFPTTIAEDKKANPTSGRSGKFISFLEQELQPFIEKRYKTNSAKTIIGQSLGGLLAASVLLTRPSLFNTYIIISPSLWWDNGSLLGRPVPRLEQTTVYIGVGREGLTPTKIPHVMEVDANVLADKLKRANNGPSKVYFDYLPLENHATVMHQAVANAFRLLYAGSAQH